MDNLRYILILIIFGISATSLASALTESFGGSNNDCSLGTSSNLDLGTSGSISDSSILSFDQGITNQRFGSATLSDAGALDIYLNTENQNRGLYAATYAYLRGSGSRTYTSSEKVSSSSVQIGEKVNVDEGYGLFFGGFAYNDKDYYSAVQTISKDYYDDNSVISMAYTNKLVASTSSTSATQKLQGLNGDIEMISWSDKGNLENEVTGFDDLFDDDGAPVTGPQYGDVTGEGGDTITTNNLPMAQAYMTLITGSTTTNYYTSSASNDKYNTKTSQSLQSQSGLDYIEGGGSCTPNEDLGSADIWLIASDLNGKSTYSTSNVVNKPDSAKASWTGSKSIKIGTASFIATQDKGIPDLDSTGVTDSVYIQSINNAMPSLTLKSTVFGSLNGAEISSKLTASGTGSHTSIAKMGDYYSKTVTDISSDSTTKSTTLTGSTDLFAGTTARAAFEGVYIRGKWSSKIPVTGVLQREGYSTDGTTTANLDQQVININKLTMNYRFTEDLEASTDALIAL